MTREEMIAVLKDSVVEVKFTKISDGSTRTMKCTLNPKMGVPEFKGPPGGSDNNVIASWDTDAKKFKSFLVKNVQSFQKI